jgi:hypothetical protein
MVPEGSEAQGTSPKQAREAARDRARAAPAARRHSVEDDGLVAGGQIYEGSRRRDPFLNPLLALKKKIEIVDSDEERGTAPPGINGMFIDQVNFVGTSEREGHYTAVVRGTDKRYYFLHEEDRLFDGFLKKITADTVVFVRETRKKSGKVERKEISKQLRRQS